MGSRGLASSQHFAGRRAYMRIFFPMALMPLSCSYQCNGRLFSCFPVHHVMKGHLPKSSVRALQTSPISRLFWCATAGQERLYVTAAPSTRRHARHPITTKAITAERHWSPPTTNGRTSNLNGNVAWKEQLISRDEDNFTRSKGEREYCSYHILPKVTSSPLPAVGYLAEASCIW